MNCQVCLSNPRRGEGNRRVEFISLTSYLLRCNFLTLRCSQVSAPIRCPFQSSLSLWSLESISFLHTSWRRVGQNIFFLLKWGSVTNFLISLNYVHIFINNLKLLSILTASFTGISVSWWNSERYVRFSLWYNDLYIHAPGNQQNIWCILLNVYFPIWQWQHCQQLCF